MRKGKISIAILAILFAVNTYAAEQTITKQDGVTVVNTTEIGKSIRGFRGPTPIKIYIKNNKVLKIEPLKNMETPKYFSKAKTLLAKYSGVSVKKAKKMSVDGVTGATFSSNALKKNVQAGIAYYLKNK